LRLRVLPTNGFEPPVSLSLQDGQEAAPAVRERDGVYVHGYAPAPSQWSGWVGRHDLDLRTGAPARALLLTGRIAWYDSTVTFSLSQHGRGWGPLRLAQVNEDGSVSPVLEDLGLPAGMDRTLVAVFAREPLAAGSHLRLSGHHRFLWDRLLTASDVEELELSGEAGSRALRDGQELRHRTCRLRSASLGFHGFSSTTGSRARHEQSYNFEAAQPDDAFAPATGHATRYGDVTPLLHEHDDFLVVLVSGDKVEVEFEPPPAPSAGMRRTYLLHVSGWAKEGTFHNLTGSSIGPLPCRSMSRYPPPDGEERKDDEYLRYLSRYQTREVRRRAP